MSEPEGHDCTHSQTCGFCLARKIQLAETRDEVERLRGYLSDSDAHVQAQLSELAEQGRSLTTEQKLRRQAEDKLAEVLERARRCHRILQHAWAVLDPGVDGALCDEIATELNVKDETCLLCESHEAAAVKVKP